MNPEQENFEQLRRLLALKRHEQPPPGYFPNFSRQVIARIVAEQHLASDRRSELPWFQRLWAAFETKPALAGAFGLVVCGLLVAGITYSDDTGSEQITLLPLVPPTASHEIGRQAFNQSVFGDTAIVNVSSTGGAATYQDSGSLFDEIRKSRNQLLPPVQSAVGFPLGN